MHIACVLSKFGPTRPRRIAVLHAHTKSSSREVDNEIAQLRMVGCVTAETGGLCFCAGHHAGPTSGGGFCFLNNVAVCARVAQRQHGLTRILILDWDIHHGNGTQVGPELMGPSHSFIHT